VHRVADEIARIAQKSTIQSALRNPHPAMTSEAAFRRALLAGYPDRVAQRRAPRSPNVLMATGIGAIVAPESGVHDGEFLIAIDVHAARPDSRTPQGGRRDAPRGLKIAPSPANDARIRIASIVDREWLTPTRIETVDRMDKATGTVKGRRIERYDALVLAEHVTAVDADAAAARLAEAWLERGPREEDERVLRRLRFSGHHIDVAETIRRAAHGARRLSDVHLVRALSVAVLKDLERNAPDTVKVPSGRHIRLEYSDDGTVSASVKLQEVFGLADTPQIGRTHTPVVLHLLSPSGRPVQVTQDLRSFWTNTYPEVRKELRGRYPKHPWPEDPWKATPTARAKPRR
jgi:ATP-dependent RNA helicase HrpB